MRTKLLEKMGQQEIIEYLKQNKGKRLTAKELSEKLNVSYPAVNRALIGLRDTDFIKCKPTTLHNKVVQFRYWV